MSPVKVVSLAIIRQLQRVDNPIDINQWPNALICCSEALAKVTPSYISTSTFLTGIHLEVPADNKSIVGKV